MPQVINVNDQYSLVPTKDYKYASWDFEYFNPVQSRLMDIFEGDSNVGIAAQTSAGKTVCAEMYMSYECRKRGGKALYIAPLKALAKQKEQEWTGLKKPHHFNDLQVSICTGDFRITKRRVNELDAADVVVMTPEMLASRCRNQKSEKSRFLQEAGVVVFDESHLLTVPGRGDHIEVALMKLAEINPDVRVVLLSATMPNVNEICEWISDITGRDTYYLESEYRPCPLNVWYESYYDGDYTYDDKEASKVGTAVGIVEYYADDKFLVFTHTKRTGRMMVDALGRAGISAEFHNADLELSKRLDLEQRFAEDPKCRVIVATSTLAWGLNLPARRVVVTGVHRGLEVVENYDIQQMIGRAGRLGLDPQGDAYVLVPESEKNETIKRLRKKTLIRSTLLEKEADRHYKTLAFHVVSEIHQGNVDTKQGFRDWFAKSLAHHQDHDFDDKVIDQTIDLLVQFGAIYRDGHHYRCTAVGRVASMFYFSPFDVSNLRRNFNQLFENHQEQDDIAVAMSLGDLDTHRWTIVNKQERRDMDAFRGVVERMYGNGRFTAGSMKIGCAYHNMLKGKKNVPTLQALQGALMSDLDRTMEVLNALDAMSCKWGQRNWFETTKLRLKYGVTPDLVGLCQIPNVGQARAKKLKQNGIETADDILNYSAESLAKIMKCSTKLAEEALEGAKMIRIKNAI